MWNEMNFELDVTPEELQKLKNQLECVRRLQKEGFFTKRPERKAVESGYKLDSHGVVYKGGGNG